MNRLEALKKEAIERNERLTAILEAGHDTSEEEYKEAGALRGRLREIKAEIEKLSELKDASDEMTRFLSEPTSPFRFGTYSKADGEAMVDPARGSVSDAKGMTREQAAAISTTSYREAFLKMLRFGEKKIYGSTEYKILQEGIDSAGGFLVPEEMQRELIMKKPAPNVVSGRVRRLQTGRDSISIPRINYTADDLYNSPIRFTQTGEIPTSGSEATYTDPSFGLTRIEVFTQMVNGALSKDMLEDSLFDIQGYIAEQFRIQADQLMENMILNGSGAGQVTGLLANPGGTVGGQTQPAIVKMGDPIGADGILNIAYTVPPQYEDNLCFVMNKTNTMRYVVTLKDSNGRYLFGSGYQDSGIASARPKELVGYPYLLAQFMPNQQNPTTGAAIANATPIIFGDLSGYYLVERVGLSIQVLDQTQAKNNQIELVGRLRFGGQTVEDWKIKIGQQA